MSFPGPPPGSSSSSSSEPDDGPNKEGRRAPLLLIDLRSPTEEDTTNEILPFLFVFDLDCAARILRAYAERGLTDAGGVEVSSPRLWGGVVSGPDGVRGGGGEAGPLGVDGRVS